MKWDILDVDEKPYCQEYGVSVPAGKLLAASRLGRPEVEELLAEDTSLHVSESACLEKAVLRLKEAAARGEKVLIGGDYDCDGLCATAILKDTLDRLGIVNGYYIPNRLQEGYGLSARTVEMAHARGYSLIVTVDNGVKAHAALQTARALGMETIVTDHHEIEEEVEADLLVHPTLMEERYSGLSGAGVVFEISLALLGETAKYTALASIAAMADVMPLWKENRRLVKRGFAAIRRGALPAASVLLRDPAQVSAESVSFQIVPKLNSVGRLADRYNVNRLVPFLLSEDPRVLQAFGKDLEGINRERRNLSETMVAQAEMLLAEDPFAIVYDERFAEGICGLAAGKLAEKYHRPTLVCAPHGNEIRGSGRSGEDFDLYGFFRQGFPELTSFGGHAQAVGLGMRKADFPAFQKKVQERMRAMHYTWKEPVHKALRINPDEVSVDALTDLKKLDPWPRELASPVFAFVHPVVLRRMDTPKVIRLNLASAAGNLEAVSFSFDALPVPERFDALIGELSVNAWKGRRSVQLRIRDIV